jgi:hypothetical protein
MPPNRHLDRVSTRLQWQGQMTVTLSSIGACTILVLIPFFVAFVRAATTTHHHKTVTQASGLPTNQQVHFVHRKQGRQVLQCRSLVVHRNSSDLINEINKGDYN